VNRRPRLRRRLPYPPGAGGRGAVARGAGATGTVFTAIPAVRNW